MNKRTCTMPECGKPHVARGLCRTHYNQQNPKRYRMVTVKCSYCGTDCMKEAGREKKYAALYCSGYCRDQDRRRTCELPDDHWARWYGATSEWAPPVVKALLAIECGWCGANFETNQPHHRYCGRSCSRKAAKVKRRAREHDATGEYTWTQVMRLHLIAGRQCSYCDQQVEQPDPDHVIPLSRGGRNDLGNILPCCRTCNSDKGDMTPDEWSKHRSLKGKPPVRTEFDYREPRFVHLMLGDAIGRPTRGTRKVRAAA